MCTTADFLFYHPFSSSSVLLATRFRHGPLLNLRRRLRDTFSRRASPNGTFSGASALADPQHVVDALHEPLLVLDTGLVARQANPAFYHTFSARPKETIGANFYKLGGDELGGGHFDVSAFREAIGHLVGQGEPFEGIGTGLLL